MSQSSVIIITDNGELMSPEDTQDVKTQNIHWPQLDEVQGFPGGSSGKELAYQCRRLRRC